MKRLGYILLLVTLLCLILAPIILRPDYLLYPRGGQHTDLTITHWPALAFNTRSLQRDGQIPLWRTTIASGGPWMANPLSGLTYPPTWLALFLPTNLALNLLLVGHIILATVATYATGRAVLDLKPLGAVLAGLAFAASPWLSGQLSAGHLNITMALPWLPVAILGIHRTAKTGRPGGALLAGIAWAAALVNYVQMGAFVVALSLAWAVLIAFYPTFAVRRRRQVGLWLLVPAVALLASAVLLFPLGEALPYLNRTELTPNEAGIFSLPWASLLTALIPTYGGEPEQLIYLGLPVALLAVLGIVLKRDRYAWFLVGVVLLTVLFAVGVHGPLFPLLVRLVPGLSWLRVPPRSWLLITFCLALLAGRGLDALSLPHLGAAVRRQVMLIGFAAIAIALSLAAGLLLLFRPPPPAVWTLAGLAMLMLAMLLLRTRTSLRPDALAIAILLLVTVDLGVVRAAWTQMLAPEAAFAGGAETAATLAGQPGLFRSYSPSYSLPQHTALQHDLELADGIDPIQLAHYAEFLASAGGYEASGYSPTLPPVLDDTSARPDAVRLGLLNVGYVVASYPVAAEGLTLQERSADTYLYRNEQSLPRAFLVAQLDPPTGVDVQLQQPIEPVPASIAVYSPNCIVIEADLEEPALLVLSEVWYPGWSAWANGREVSIYRVEGALRGIYLEPGSYSVEYRYSPWTVWVGLAISGCTAVALLTYAGYRAWRRS